jgi:hypothetical protein
MRKRDFAGAEAVRRAEGNMNGAVTQGAAALPWSLNSSRWKGSRRNLGGLGFGRRWDSAGPHREGEEP